MHHSKSSKVMLVCFLSLFVVVGDVVVVAFLLCVGIHVEITSVTDF